MANPADSKRPDDRTLVVGAIDGDQECFGALVNRYWNTAVALAISRIANPSQAEDIAQESFVQAYSHLSTLRDPSRFAGWLSRVVIQKSIDYARASRRQAQSATLAVLESGAAPGCRPEEYAGLSGEQTRLVCDAIGRLPEKFRTVVVLRFISGLSTEEIARQLGKRHGTVRVWLHRAYRKLREELAPLAEEVIHT
jgi:RNA polymerase sigma-70 factor, ECF subfamily